MHELTSRWCAIGISIGLGCAGPGDPAGGAAGGGGKADDLGERPAAAAKPFHTIPAPETGERFGFSVAGVGDVDGDGAGDIAVGAPGPLFAESPGALYVYSSGSHELLYSVVGEEEGSEFGHAVAVAHDADGDGIRDILVGAPGTGHLYVLSGADGIEIERIATGDSGGFSVASVGDVDGDLVDDVAAGGPFRNLWCGKSLGTTGAVWVFSGATWKQIRFVEGFKFDWFGYSLAKLGDVDGDRRDDIAVGSIKEVWSTIYAGAVVVLDAGVKTQSCKYGVWDAIAVSQGRTGDDLGYSVAAIGDVDGDDVTDVIAGAPGRDGDNSYGAIVSGADGRQLEEVEGFESFSFFGASAHGIGDIDGDKVRDFAVGAPNDMTETGPWQGGVVHLFSGADGDRLDAFEGAGGLGMSLSTYKDELGCRNLIASTGKPASFGYTGKVLLYTLPCLLGADD